jgi:hypothetical protein
MSRTADKVAFIHSAKAAGRYIDYHLCSRVFDNAGSDISEQEFKTFNSWQPPYLLGRDWTERELLQLANNCFAQQYPTPAQVRAHHRRWTHDYLAKQYVHNHHHGWSGNSVAEFRRNGWFTFMFIREPAEQLCSLWTWTRRELAAGADPGRLLRPERLAQLPLDAFVREIIGTPELKPFYALPDYVDNIEYVAEFTEDNFRRLLRDRFRHVCRPELDHETHRHASGNPGYAIYRSRGWIADETHAMIEDDPEVQRIRRRLG